MISFTQWLEQCQNIYNKDYDNILGESYKNMKLFMKHLDKDPFVIVMSVERSIYRGLSVQQKREALKNNKLYQKIINKNDSENVNATVEFRSALRSVGAKYLSVVGKYEESDRETGDIMPREEVSTVVFIKPGSEGEKVLNTCIKYAKKFDQDSILVASREVGFFFYTNNTKDNKAGDIIEIGKFNSNKIGDYFSTFETKKRSRYGYESFYNEKGKTNKSTTSFEFGNFPIEPIQRYLKEGLIDIELPVI